MNTLHFKCCICKKDHSLELSDEQIDLYYHELSRGKHIQDIFPEMSRVDREKFISGMCEECQEKIFC